MRMWLVNPALLCRQHLLGEHVEMHMFAGHILEGYVLYPRFLGDRVELPAVWVIFALFAGGDFGLRYFQNRKRLRMSKQDIRELSRRAGLPTWDEPASACLSSRIPYASEVTVEKLRLIEQAEAAVRALGFRVCRVRHHDALARLEIGQDEMARALEPAVRDALVAQLKALGYQHVALDLRGYRTGSLNEGVVLRPA